MPIRPNIASRFAGGDGYLSYLSFDKKKERVQDAEHGRCSMPQVWPWYSIAPGETVHHDNTRCPEGRMIPEPDRKPGTGGLPLCRHCARLDAEGE